MANLNDTLTISSRQNKVFVALCSCQIGGFVYVSSVMSLLAALTFLSGVASSALGATQEAQTSILAAIFMMLVAINLKIKLPTP